MPLTLSDVERIAHLSRIEMSPAQGQRTLEQFHDIFTMIARMQAVDTTGIEPMAHPTAHVGSNASSSGEQRFRDDAATPASTEQRERNMQSAPAQQDGLFLVSKVIE